MFEDTSFQVDEESEEFKLLNPVVSKQFEKTKTKTVQMSLREVGFVFVQLPGDCDETVKTIEIVRFNRRL